METTEVPEGYEARECYICKGTGQKYDASMADCIARPTDWMTCFKCRGRGYTLHITPEGMSAEWAAFEAKRAAQ